MPIILAICRNLNKKNKTRFTILFFISYINILFPETSKSSIEVTIHWRSPICSQSIVRCSSSSSLSKSSTKNSISFFWEKVSMNDVSVNFSPKRILLTSPRDAKCVRGILSITIRKSSRCGQRRVFRKSSSLFLWDHSSIAIFSQGEEISIFERYSKVILWTFPKK